MWISLMYFLEYEEEFEDTKKVIRIRNSKDRQYNGQMTNGQTDKQWSTKHYTQS